MRAPRLKLLGCPILVQIRHQLHLSALRQTKQLLLRIARRNNAQRCANHHPTNRAKHLLPAMQRISFKVRLARRALSQHVLNLRIALRQRQLRHIPPKARMTEAQAIVEIEKVVGHPIAPQKTISFEPGHFKEVWQGNVMTLGLASGFVEPLEATSIGQMLEQLRQFRLVLADTNGVVSQKNIDNFNQANCAFWDGIRDFLRMHYDCPRRDTLAAKHITRANPLN